jgi:hypothetical protein
MSDEPIRLREGGSAFLKNALESARRDVPDEDRATRLEARILPLLVPPPPAPAPPTPPPPAPGPAGGGAGLAKGGAVAAAGLKGLSLVKAAVVGLATVAIVGGASVAYLDRAPNTPPAPQSSGVVATALEPSATLGLAPLAPLAPLASSAPLAPASSPSVDRPKGPLASAEPKQEDDPVAEMALLHSAQDALRTSPSSALGKTAEHARRFPRSALAQEREVIAVEALVKLGRKDEARARVARFEKTYPGSTHARRLAALVE